MKFMDLLESTLPANAKRLSKKKHKYQDKEALDWKSPSAKLNVKEHLKFLQEVEKENKK